MAGARQAGRDFILRSQGAGLGVRRRTGKPSLSGSGRRPVEIPPERRPALAVERISNRRKPDAPIFYRLSACFQWVPQNFEK